MGIISSFFIDTKLKKKLPFQIHKSFENKNKKNIHLILDIDCTLLYASNIKDYIFKYIHIYF